jgi:hypothetical protein
MDNVYFLRGNSPHVFSSCRLRNMYGVGYSYAEVTGSPEMCHLQDPVHLRAVKG